VRNTNEETGFADISSNEGYGWLRERLSRQTRIPGAVR
jgi:hypothetical protein